MIIDLTPIRAGTGPARLLDMVEDDRVPPIRTVQVIEVEELPAD